MYFYEVKISRSLLFISLPSYRILEKHGEINHILEGNSLRDVVTFLINVKLIIIEISNFKSKCNVQYFPFCIYQVDEEYASLMAGNYLPWVILRQCVISVDVNWVNIV